MKKYNINISGCDDSTKFSIELTEDQASFLRVIADLSEKTSTYGCQPVLHMSEAKA